VIVRGLRILRPVSGSWIIAALVLLFLLSPFVVVLGASFDTAGSYHVSFPPRGLTWQWYAAIPQTYIKAAGISLIVGIAVAVIAGLIGTTAALGLVRSSVPGKELLQSFFRLPVQIPLVVTGAVFLQFYWQVSAVLGWNPLNSLAGLVIAHLFVALPYVVGSVSAILVRINPRFEEAARSLGATEWSTFWRVTFPLMRPGVAAGMFYAFIVSFGDVPIAIFLVQSERTTLPVLIFQDMQFDFRPSMLAASIIVVIASLALILAVQRFAGLDVILPSKRK
jgi:putative spermidine/putrescine transport system permease protein